MKEIWIVFNTDDIAKHSRRVFIDSVWNSEKKAKDRLREVIIANNSMWCSPRIEKHEINAISKTEKI